MILSDEQILDAMGRGEIKIEPFVLSHLGGNSYDVRLAPVLRVHAVRSTIDVVHAYARSRHAFYGMPNHSPYSAEFPPRFGLELHDLVYSGMGSQIHHNLTNDELDMVVEPRTLDVRIPDDGLLLLPGILYLASTIEYTETLVHVPYLDGRSSAGRLGVSIHVTAGRGDVGFKNHWTMELWVVQPVRVYHGIRIGQLTYHTVHGDVQRDYASKQGTTYGTLARDPLPQPSRIWTKIRDEESRRLVVAEDMDGVDCQSATEEDR